MLLTLKVVEDLPPKGVPAKKRAAVESAIGAAIMLAVQGMVSLPPAHATANWNACSPTGRLLGLRGVSQGARECDQAVRKEQVGKMQQFFE